MAVIQRKINSDVLGYLMAKAQATRPNRYQSLALLGFEEAFQRLLERRDAIDEIRMTFSVQSLAERAELSDAEQKRLYERTEQFFQAFYTALSQLNSVVVRHSDVFGQLNLRSQKQFVEWVSAVSGEEDHEVRTGLERSRLFRAMLDHPEDFPPYTWATQNSFDNLLFHVLLHGPATRSGTIPRGATREHYRQVDAWHFAAPDEVSVTNNLGKVALRCIALMYDSKAPGQAFRSTQMRTWEEFYRETAGLATRISSQP